MKFLETPIADAFIAEIEAIEDERGFFARMFSEEEFHKHGIEFSPQHINNSYNRFAGTLRGLHYQLPPKEEIKVVRCIKGALFDVVLDLRVSSPTFGKWYGVELTERNRRMLIVPHGCAHGFMTVQPETELLYLVSAPYDFSLERGVRWDDPYFSIRWPMAPTVISEKDRRYSNFNTFSTCV